MVIRETDMDRPCWEMKHNLIQSLMLDASRADWQTLDFLPKLQTRTIPVETRDLHFRHGMYYLGFLDGTCYRIVMLNYGRPTSWSV